MTSLRQQLEDERKRADEAELMVSSLRADLYRAESEARWWRGLVMRWENVKDETAILMAVVWVVTIIVITMIMWS